MEADRTRVRSKSRNVYVGSNPYTGKPYFERRKEKVVDLSQPPEEPPNEDSNTEPMFPKELSEKMKIKFEDAGCPTKGSEPEKNFKPDPT